MEQPEIEFLLTNPYGFAYSGKRNIPGLSVKIVGSPVPTFQSGKTNSDMFGEALYCDPPGYALIDAPAEELAFSGNSNEVTSFTLAFYYHVPTTVNSVFEEITIHGYTDEYYDWHYFRLFPEVWTDGVTAAICIRYTTPELTTPVTTWAYVPSAKMQGWVHVTFTYDRSSGNFKIYMDGQLEVQQTITN